jgi:hypothetical protein
MTKCTYMGRTPRHFVPRRLFSLEAGVEEEQLLVYLLNAELEEVVRVMVAGQLEEH